MGIFETTLLRINSLVESRISDFNLRRDNKPNDVDFDDDEVGVVQIEHNKAKHILKKLVTRILDETITEDEVNFFKDHYLEYANESLYTVKTTNELKELIKWCCSYLGTKCNLNWIDVSLITDMTSLFYKSEFNGDISNWNVSNVKKMKKLFDECKFNGDISKWDVSNVISMSEMFYDSVFDGDISLWDTRNVKSMCCMFHNSKFNRDISNWDVRNVTDMSYMFTNSSFDQDLSKWSLDSVCSKHQVEGMFNDSPMKEYIYGLKWPLGYIRLQTY